MGTQKFYLLFCYFQNVQNTAYCDGKGGEIDICGICGGKGESCSCVYYKTFSIDELDCILFQRSLNHTIDAVETSINELYTTLVGLSDFDSNCWQNNFFDLSTQLDFIQDSLQCVDDYSADLSEFESDIGGHLQECR